LEEDLANFLEDFCDFLDSLEASVVKMKQQIAKLVGVEEKPKFQWNPEALKWAVCEGFKGAYERYPKEGKKAEAIQDYKNLLEDLKRHNGRLTREGYFYWLFQDNATIGRKKRGS
jgi:hypothetical protein